MRRTSRLGCSFDCADVSLSVRWQNTLRTVFGEEEGMFFKSCSQVSHCSREEASWLNKATENPVGDSRSTVEGYFGSLKEVMWHATS
jgi:hypothetical protein